MKQFVTPPLTSRHLPAFSWARQALTPTWEAGPGSPAGRFRAVGTATNTAPGPHEAWSGTGPLRMGGATSTLTEAGRIAVQLG